jgi:hypothetical protein
VERAEEATERYAFHAALRAVFLAFAFVSPHAEAKAEALVARAVEIEEEYPAKAEAIEVSLAAIADCIQATSTFGFAEVVLVAVAANTGAAIAEARRERPPNINTIFFIGRWLDLDLSATPACLSAISCAFVF